MNERDSERAIIQRFSTQAEANIIKALLEGAGIHCFLDNVSLSDLFPSNPMNAFEIELSVKKKDEKLAREILAAKFDKKDMR